MAGANKLVTAGGGGVVLTPASSIASDKTMQIPSIDGTLIAADALGNVGIGTSSPTAKADISGGEDGLQMRLQRTSDAGFVLSETTGNYNWKVKASGGGLYFQTSTTGYNTGYANKVGITSAGDFLVGATSIGAKGLSNVVDPNGIYSLWNVTANGFGVLQFRQNGTGVGSVVINTTTVSYNTSSDYRLKENIAPMTGALSVVQQLKPCTYSWKADGSDGQGFIAHELQEVVPDCVTGAKDAVDADGNPIYQGIDTSFLVATLTAAIQELKAELDAVKAQLENK